jgi:F0F1-type ATP synthase membrane subunit b/b'
MDQDQDRSESDLRAELHEVERDLENLRKSAASIRADVGDAEDPTDRGALIQQADELDGLVERLVVRREDLLRLLAKK